MRSRCGLQAARCAPRSVCSQCPALVRAILCIRRRAIRLVEAGPGLPGRVLHIRLLSDQAALEIAAQGFERPLLSLVREWEVP